MSEFYVAVLARNSEGEIFATIPDLPGVNSAAATEREALSLAVEFANDYVRDLIAEGHDVPTARALLAIPIEAEDEEIGRALIPVEVPGKSVKISISIDEALLTRIDRAAERTGLTRSGFIAAATEDRIRTSVSGNRPYTAKSDERPYGFSENGDSNERSSAFIFPRAVGLDERFKGYLILKEAPHEDTPMPGRRKSPVRKGPG